MIKDKIDQPLNQFIQYFGQKTERFAALIRCRFQICQFIESIFFRMQMGKDDLQWAANSNDSFSEFYDL